MEKLKYSKEQVQVLEEEFNKANYIVSENGDRLARELGITVKQLRIWYQNRRAKLRREALKVGNRLSRLTAHFYGSSSSLESSTESRSRSVSPGVTVYGTSGQPYYPSTAPNTIPFSPRPPHPPKTPQYFNYPQIVVNDGQLREFDDSAQGNCPLLDTLSSFTSSYIESDISASSSSMSVDTSLDFSELLIDDSSKGLHVINESHPEEHYRITHLGAHQQMMDNVAYNFRKEMPSNVKQQVCRLSSSNSVTSMILDMQQDHEGEEVKETNDFFVKSLVTYLTN